MDQVRILDLVTIRVVDRVPLVRVAKLALRDLRQTVALLHRDRAHLLVLVRRCRRAATLHIREIGTGCLIVRRHRGVSTWLRILPSRPPPPPPTLGDLSCATCASCFNT